MTAPKLRQTPLKRKSPMIRPTLAAVAGRFANDRPRGSVSGISPMQAKTELLSGLTVALALVPEAVAFAFVLGAGFLSYRDSLAYTSERAFYETACERSPNSAVAIRVASTA